jgi:hypothetical protein
VTLKTAHRSHLVARTAGPATLTPEWTEKDLSDPQLAAAVKTLLAKVAGGEYLKVGQSASEAIAAQQERQEHLQQERK